MAKINIHPKMLQSAQRDIKRRYLSYKKGGQQGLEMIWRNTMVMLMAAHVSNESERVKNKV